MLLPDPASPDPPSSKEKANIADESVEQHLDLHLILEN